MRKHTIVRAADVNKTPAALNTTQITYVMPIETTTPETWKDIPNCAGYQISDIGEIRSSRRAGSKRINFEWKILKHKIANKHHFVRLFGKTRYIHTLMLEAFVGPRPNGEFGRHLDDNPDRNILSNLKWGTISDNQVDIMLNSIRWNQKLDIPKVKKIRELINQGITGKEISKMFGVGKSQISRIKYRERWAWLD